MEPQTVTVHCDDVKHENEQPMAVIEPKRLHFKQATADGTELMQFTEDGGETDVVTCETPQAFQTMLENHRSVFGVAFKTELDYQDFMKLPINKEQRFALFAQLTSNKRKTKRAKPV